jgi:hypothetical protein
MTESLPSTEVVTRMAEAMRSIAQANADYMQELMRANTALLTAFMQRAGGETEEPPSECARHRRVPGPDRHLG